MMRAASGPHQHHADFGKSTGSFSTASTMSSVSSSSQPSSPTKPGSVISDVFKPNPHPYAIKTTSTGILSRSSSKSNAHSQNHFVPVSPSPSPTKSNFTSYTERGSRHRYSRSLTEDNNPRPLPVPPEEQYYPHPNNERPRSRAHSLTENLDDTLNPKSWPFEQLAVNVPDIADFVRENEITGRAFLRFDDGVLDAYGVTQQWQRSLILQHSRRLRQSMLQNRTWPTSNPQDNPDAVGGRLSSPSKVYRSLPNDEDDPAYLSSSSSISSVSSISGRKKRQVRPNGRVHGMVASFERSASPDKADFVRARSGSVSSSQDDDEFFLPPEPTGSSNRRPFKFPPPSKDEYPSSGPLLLPQSSFPNHFPGSMKPLRATGNVDQAAPHATGDAVTTNPTVPSRSTPSPSRPLPALPLHPSLRPPPVLSDYDDDVLDDPKIAPKNTSGEMTMDELISILDPNSSSKLPEAPTFVNTDRRRGREKGEKRTKKGAAAWEMEVGDTVKHVPVSSTSSTLDRSGPVDDELTVEELLSLESSSGSGAAAWVDQPDGVGRTMKRISGDGQTTAERNTRFGSISKGKSLKALKGLSLSTGRSSHGQNKKQSRRVGELFAPEVEGPLEEKNEVEDWRRPLTEELEVERMKEVERNLLRAEEEERQRWELEAEAAKGGEGREHDHDEGSLVVEEEGEVRRQEDGDVRIRRLEEELFQKQQVLETETRQRLAAAEAEAQRVKEASEQRRQEEELRIRQLEEQLLQKQQTMKQETRRRIAEAEAGTQRAREEAAADRQRQEDAEQRLALSLAENRRMIDEFRLRLEQVEHRIDVLQEQSVSIRPSSPTHSQGNSSTCVSRRLRMLAAWALSTPFGALLPISMTASLASFVRADIPVNEGEASRAIGARPIFPRYTFFLGIGFCAFMLRGLMKLGIKGLREIGSAGARGVRGR